MAGSRESLIRLSKIKRLVVVVTKKGSNGSSSIHYMEQLVERTEINGTEWKAAARLLLHCAAAVK